MTRPALTAHDHFEALALGRRVAAELAAEALDPAALLSMADRLALATLSLAVEAEAARRAGAEPRTAEMLPVLSAGLARVEREAASLPIPAALAAGSAAVAMHASVMECSRRAMLPQQPSDAGSRLRRDAANSARTLIELTEAIQRRRGKGTRQTVRVERVIVNEGGQALVAGAVTTAAPLPASPPVPSAIGQGAPPMAILDAKPAAVGQGEGERDAGSDG